MAKLASCLRGEINTLGVKFMRKTAVLTDALTGITAFYHSPPWHLEAIKQHTTCTIVILSNEDGTRRLIPIKPDTQDVHKRFANW